MSYVNVGNVRVAEELYQFINEEALPDTKVDVEQFWQDFSTVMTEFSAKNKQLLQEREDMQNKINAWHHENSTVDSEEYQQFLKDIGYLEDLVEDFKIDVDHVDDEIAQIAGPQLVVPINNPRYAINAANSRWGSLYDAFYGTDLIDETDGKEKGTSYNPVRGDVVVEKSKQFLDDTVPLEGASHLQATEYKIVDGSLVVTMEDDSDTKLKDEAQFIGYQGPKAAPSTILLKNNGLHLEIQIDSGHPIGKTDPAHVKDVFLESAITSIMDLEDSIAAVDAEDKVDVYRNWKGLVRGELSTTFKKGEELIERRFNPDRIYKSTSGETVSLSGRVLMLVRNVGHLMTNSAVLLEDGSEAFEGVLDGIVTSLIAKQNLLGHGEYINSQEGSVYIVKPKMHGSKEVAFTDALFARIEEMLGMDKNTLKIGVMDEERRTSVNLKNCIHAAKERAIFINTGWLDRTGDEIHTSMECGPMNRTADMKGMEWFQSYEKNNVATGLHAGFQHHAQIGKGMWPKPDNMDDMWKEKIGHVKAGANTAWVPSPTAATVHAMHYHGTNVTSVQNELQSKGTDVDYRKEILDIPVAKNPNWSKEEVMEELENNAQKMLGYVVRWVEQGVGCSKVPDINNIGMMEDRATLRISSQLITNWLRHGVTSEKEVMDILKRMAKVVDEQNKGDEAYRNMAPNYDESVAFQAAKDLVFKGTEQPSGYTEPILHKRRLEFKNKFKVGN